MVPFYFKCYFTGKYSFQRVLMVLQVAGEKSSAGTSVSGGGFLTEAVNACMQAFPWLEMEMVTDLEASMNLMLIRLNAYSSAMRPK
jgi:hypothetical protein